MTDSATRDREICHRPKSKTRDQSRYICLGSYDKKSQYLSLEQHPLILAWWLYWYGKPLGFRGRGLRKKLSGCKRLFSLTIMLLYYRYFFSPPDNDILELPASGQMCLGVHGGFKVFNFHRKIVTKLFSPKTDPASVRREIAWVCRVGVHSFAPTVHRWSVAECWYEEDYVNGISAAYSDSRRSTCTLQESVVPLIARIMLAAPKQKASAAEYVLKQSEFLLGEQIPLADKHEAAANGQRINRFLEVMIERVNQAGIRPISLVYSHGDLSPKHILMTKHGDMIIDWEVAGYRSALFDFYHAFFRRFWGGKGVAPGMRGAIEKAIFQLRLTLNASTGNKSLLSCLDAAQVYRWIYYIERICLYVKPRKKTMTESQLNKTLHFIDACHDYEVRLLNRTSRSV